MDHSLILDKRLRLLIYGKKLAEGFQEKQSFLKIFLTQIEVVPKNWTM